MHRSGATSLFQLPVQDLVQDKAVAGVGLVGDVVLDGPTGGLCLSLPPAHPAPADVLGVGAAGRKAFLDLAAVQPK